MKPDEELMGKGVAFYPSQIEMIIRFHPDISFSQAVRNIVDAHLDILRNQAADRGE